MNLVRRRLSLGALFLLASGFCFVGSTLLVDARERTLLFNTALVVAGTWLLALPLSATLAFLLTRTRVPARSWWLFWLALLAALPLYLQLVAWDAAGGILGWFTLWTQTRSDPIFSGLRGAILVHAIYAIPWSALIMSGAFQVGHAVWEEQALLDADASAVGLRITLPQLLPGLWLGTACIVVLTAGEMTVTNIYLVRTYAEEVYTYFARSGNLDVRLPATLPLVGFTAGLLLLAASGCSALPRDIEYSRPYEWRWRSIFWPTALLSCVIGSLFLVPLANLVLQGGLEVFQADEGLARRWSLSKWMELLGTTPARFWRELLDSVQLSMVVATLSWLVGATAAWWSRKTFVSTMLTSACAVLCVSTPPTLVGLAVVALFNQPGWDWLLWLYDRTLLPPALAITLRVWPFAFALLAWSWRTFDRGQYEAAKLEGASQSEFLRFIFLPQRGLWLWAAWWLAALMAWGDLSTSILTLPPGFSTVAYRLFGLVHSGVNDQVAALALWAWLVIGLIAAGLFFLLRSATRANNAI